MKDNATLLPWLDVHWQQLAQRNSDNRLPHALLVTGNGGVGKSSFAAYAAQSLLCSDYKEAYCGQCKSCKLFAAGTHPDLIRVTPPDGKQIIGIDPIRKLIDEMVLTPQCGQRKIALIDPADAMNVQGANCLLKTLEEPAAADMLILVTSSPGLLPATIRSRCQEIYLTVSDEEKAIIWLSKEGVDNPHACLTLDSQAPLNALSLADESTRQRRSELLRDLVTTFAGTTSIEVFLSKYTTMPTPEILKLFSQWFATGIKIKMNCTVQSNEKNEISCLIKNISIEKIFIIYNKIQRLSRIDTSSFKTRTVLEGLLADMRLVHIN